MIAKQELTKLYVDLELTMHEIAKIKNCAYSTINKYINKHNIPPRKPGFKKGHKFSADHKRKISESKRGTKHPNFGKKCRSRKRYWYKCPDGKIVSMRSRWEVAYAHFLTDQGVIWEYEPVTFQLPDGSAYTPDFYLVETERYIEIKGWYTQEHREKIALFRENHGESLSILQRHELKEMGVDLDKDYPSAEVPKNQCEQCCKKFFRKDKQQRFCGNKCKNKWIANNRHIKKKVMFSQSKRKYHGNQLGSKNNGAKLTESDVRDIINLRATGKLLGEIAETKNISIGNVGNILKGRSWKHVSRKI